MGSLHAGHLSLVRQAKRRADVVILSIYVNPTQFGPHEDLDRYPRPRRRDLALAREQGVDIVFAPRTLYHPDHSTWVEETVCSQGRCGARRPGHFRGVATVVLKLFQLTQPHFAVFGLKDAQQLEVIERMTRDLNLPVKILRSPIVRDSRGLALSSRNQYLSATEYEQALALPRALKTAARAASVAEAESIARSILERAAGIQIEYIETVRGRLCAAVWVGTTRLIDNVALNKNLR